MRQNLLKSACGTLKTSPPSALATGIARTKFAVAASAVTNAVEKSIAGTVS